jgi:hypothetical protein
MKVNLNISIIISIIILIFILAFRLFTFTENFENIEQSNPNKIAFLFLTYNNLKRPDIWNKFFDIDIDIDINNSGNTNNISKYTNKYNIYLHAKEPDKITDVILKGKQIPEHIETCWGCFGTIEANIMMMKEALKDPLNKKFILVSESCIPIVPFDKFYSEVMTDEKSRIYIHSNNNPERYDNITNPSFPKNEFTKHSGQGLIFNRQYAHLLINSLNEFKYTWQNMNSVDEHYFGNILRILDPNFNSSVSLNKTTFDIWSKDDLDTNKINDDDIVTDSYINIKKISNNAIDKLRDKNFILARKLDTNTEIDIHYIV